MREIGQSRGACSLDRDRLQCPVRATCLLEREAVEIVRRRIGENQRSLLSVELDAMTAAEKRGAAHLQAAGGPGRKCKRQRDAAFDPPGKPDAVRLPRLMIGPQNHSR